MNKHTPGPWKIYGTRGRGSVLYIMNDAGDPGLEFDLYEDMTEADARLVVKSPEMYDILRELAQCRSRQRIEELADLATTLVEEIDGEELE